MNSLKMWVQPTEKEAWVMQMMAQAKSRPRKVYLIGSLRNPDIAKLAIRLREALPGTTVFDDWLGAGQRKAGICSHGQSRAMGCDVSICNGCNGQRGRTGAMASERTQLC